jgi:hypothetical protein
MYPFIIITFLNILVFFFVFWEMIEHKKERDLPLRLSLYGKNFFFKKRFIFITYGIILFLEIITFFILFLK